MGLNSLKTNFTFIRNDSILNTDDEVRAKMVKLFNDDVSPSLADDLVLKEYPSTFMIVCKSDPLRDEGFIFFERMKKLGVNVKYSLYDCKHRTKLSEPHALKDLAFLNFFIQELNL
jgi:acetyl esterase/lipase